MAGSPRPAALIPRVRAVISGNVIRRGEGRGGEASVDIAAWLHSLGMQQYDQAFRDRRRHGRRAGFAHSARLLGAKAENISPLSGRLDVRAFDVIEVGTLDAHQLCQAHPFRRVGHADVVEVRVTRLQNIGPLRLD